MALSERVKGKLEKIRSNFPTEQALLIPALHFVQEEAGWVSMDAQKAIGEFLHLPLSKVREVISFYTMFKQAPVGKVNLQLCVNISCWLNGSDKLLSCMEKRLGVGCGETTKDGKYTISEVECLASCGTAPVLQVNEDYYENLNVDELNKIMDKLDQDLAQGKKDIGCSSRQEFNHV
jgi:NADH-quinone oxidoreductase subunit E